MPKKCINEPCPQEPYRDICDRLWETRPKSPGKIRRKREKVKKNIYIFPSFPRATFQNVITHKIFEILML
jgi:hypothetical protein